MRPTLHLKASLRYRRPYWMLSSNLEDNYKIYMEMHKPEHQRVEMTYQAWLGGLDRPYMRPRCMATQPLWLEKKRHQLRPSNLTGPETPLERYVLQWEEKFHSFRGTLRPAADDMHIAFELVERPLDLSYALLIMDYCRNENDIPFAKDSFRIFLEACLRVDRKDVALAALQNAEKLGFWHVDEDERKFVLGEQDWYHRFPDGRVLPERSGSAAGETTVSEAKLAAELAELEILEKQQAKSGRKLSPEEEEAALLAELEALEASSKSK